MASNTPAQMFVLHVTHFYDSGCGSDYLSNEVLCVSNNREHILKKPTEIM